MTKPTFSPDPARGCGRTRRFWLMGGVAGIAAIAGAGVAWREHQTEVGFLSSESALWQGQFTQLDGSQLKMSSLRGKPLVLNFWATWCPPCVEELPLLNRFYQENAVNGWQVLGLAVDQLEPVRRFLIKTPLAFRVALAGFPGIELSKSLGNLGGALPFTVVLRADGKVAHRKMGKINAEDLQRWALLR